MLHMVQFYCELDEKFKNYKKETVLEKFKPYLDEDFITIACNSKGKVNRIYIFVDIIKLLEKRNITEEDYTMCERKINTYLLRNSLNLNDLTLIKLEYRYDFITNSRAERKLYMESMCKGLTKINRKIKDIKGKENFIPTLYYKNKSVTVKIYAKEEERIAKNKPLTNRDADVLRFELTLNNKHLNNQKQYKNSSKELKSYMNDIKYRKYMLDNFKKILYEGNFYTNEEALQKISKANLKEAEREKMLKNTKCIQHYGIQALSKKIGVFRFKTYINLMNQIKVNPLSFKQKNNNEFLINPFEKF